MLIEIAAAGLCHSDLSGIGGIRPRPVPVVLGQEGAGVVREGVADLRPGDHVVTVFVTSLEKINAAFDRLAEGGVLRQILRPNG